MSRLDGEPRPAPQPIKVVLLEQREHGGLRMTTTVPPLEALVMLEAAKTRLLAGGITGLT